MNLTSSLATPADIDELVLREEDAKEASEGWRDVCKAVVSDSWAWAFRDPQGALAGIGGIQVTDTMVVPWLLCSDVASKYPKDVMRLAQRAMAILRKAPPYKVVGNMIPPHSLRNRAFVKKLGFTLHQDHFSLQRNV